MKKKILIIGAASILSNYLISDLKENFKVYLLFNKRKRIISKTKRINLDLNKKKDLKTMIKKYVFYTQHNLAPQLFSHKMTVPKRQH